MSVNTQQIDQLNQTFPIRESAFYSEIKSSTETGDKHAFALLMSMLTTDAQELDEFHLPEVEAAKVKSDLYNQFHIQQQQLTGKFNSARSVSHNELIQQGDKTSVLLDLVLQPEPLLPEQSPLPQAVLDNIEPNVKARLNLQQASVENTSPVIAEKKPTKEIDVEAWFEVLHQSRTLSVAA